MDIERDLILTEEDRREINKLLKMTSSMPYVRYDDVILYFNIKFPNSVQIDIKIINNSTGPVIEVVLLSHGFVIVRKMDDEKTLLSQYKFEFNFNDYIVNIK